MQVFPSVFGLHLLDTTKQTKAGSNHSLGFPLAIRCESCNRCEPLGRRPGWQSLRLQQITPSFPDKDEVQLPPDQYQKPDR